MGYKSNHATLNDIQKEEILDKYEYYSSTNLAQEYNVARGVITKLWLDNGKKGKSKNKYKFDEDYFNKINTKDKAYFLGLLASDGCVYNRNVGKSKFMINLALQESDKYILEIFKKYLNFNKPLTINYTENINHDNYATLQIVSDLMASDLAKYGVIERKTQTYKAILPKNFESHFIRGYLDGDGSIYQYIRNDKDWLADYNIIVLSGYEHNIIKFQEYLKEIGINTSFIQDKRSEISFGDLRVNSLLDKYCFLKFLYQDCDDLYLIRKKSIADDFIKKIEHSNHTIHINAINNYITN